MDLLMLAAVFAGCGAQMSADYENMVKFIVGEKDPADDAQWAEFQKTITISRTMPTTRR